jgi:hypothetical protein
MLIKIMPYMSKEPHRKRDVARHVRYLLTGKVCRTDSSESSLRLAGPPHAQRIIQRVLPSDDYRRAASDVAHQMVAEVLAGYVGEARPHQLYAHVVLSLVPRFRSRTALAPIEVADAVGMQTEGTFFGALRISLDTLARLDADTRYPLYLVVHADRRHLHAHALVGLYAQGAPPCRITTFNSSTIRAIARAIDHEHGLAKPSHGLRNAHGRLIAGVDD